MNEKKINNWEYHISYSTQNEKKIPILKIKPDKEIIKPTTLSKYYALNNNNVLAFINQQFYVSQPDDLNDLFDFYLDLIDFSNHEFSHIEMLFTDGQERDNARQEFQSNKHLFLEKVRNSLYRIWISTFGILCMTEDKVNDLMWAHYTNNRGFLIEFDYDKFGSNYFGPYPINYIEKLEKLDFCKFENNLGFFMASLLKKLVWEYEKEFRFFCLPEIKNNFKVSGRFSNAEFNFDLQDRLVNYPRSAIKKVLLGFHFYSENITTSIGQYEYFLNFRSENSLLKIALLNKIIQEKIPTEVCVQDRMTFCLTSIPIEITHIDRATYKVKEFR